MVSFLCTSIHAIFLTFRACFNPPRSPFPAALRTKLTRSDFLLSLRYFMRWCNSSPLLRPIWSPCISSDHFSGPKTELESLDFIITESSESSSESSWVDFWVLSSATAADLVDCFDLILLCATLPPPLLHHETGVWNQIAKQKSRKEEEGGYTKFPRDQIDGE